MELHTVGDHLRKRRLDLGLLQRDVAAQIGVNTATVANWELGHTAPALRWVPTIVQFLEYAPMPPASSSIAKRLNVSRRLIGLSQKALARRLGIDPTTLARWERGTRRPTGKFAAIVETFFAKCET